MKRRPPKASNTFRLNAIYRVHRETGFARMTYHLQSLSRKPAKLKNQEGRYVTYDGGLRRLRAAPELQHLLSDILQGGDLIVVDGTLYNPATHRLRQFFLCWDDPMLPEARPRPLAEDSTGCKRDMTGGQDEVAQPVAGPDFCVEPGI
jgi:hypothetical protein